MVEALDEVDGALLGELELVLQNRRRLREADVLSPARQSHPAMHTHEDYYSTENSTMLFYLRLWAL